VQLRAVCLQTSMPKGRACQGDLQKVEVTYKMSLAP
jgi:hypothetical protein